MDGGSSLANQFVSLTKIATYFGDNLMVAKIKAHFLNAAFIIDSPDFDRNAIKILLNAIKIFANLD